jgi:hypothetical protein
MGNLFNNGLNNLINCQSSYISYINIHLEKIVDLKLDFKDLLIFLYGSQMD